MPHFEGGKELSDPASAWRPKCMRVTATATAGVIVGCRKWDTVAKARKIMQRVIVRVWRGLGPGLRR